MILLRAVAVLFLVLCSGVKVHGEHDTNLSKLLQMIEKDVEAIQQAAADDKALGNEEQIPEIYEDGTKETTDEDDTSSLVANEDDDKKRTRRQWRKIFCAFSRKTKTYHFNCNKLKKWKRKKYCRSLQGRKCRVITTLVHYHGGDHEGESQQEEYKMENELDEDINAYDKALENEEQIPEIYEDGTKEMTDEGEDSGVILADDDKKWKKKLARLFCRHKPNGQYWVNCDRIRIERRKKYCRSLQGRKCRVITPPVNYHGGDQEGESQQEENKMENELDEGINAYDTSSLLANEDDDKKRTRKQWRKIFCAVSLKTTTYKFNCNKLKKWKRKKNCKSFQSTKCRIGVRYTSGDQEEENQQEENKTENELDEDTNAYDTSSLLANEDDDKKRTREQWRKIFCAVSRKTKTYKFNCNNLKRWKRKKSCLAYQNAPCSRTSITAFMDVASPRASLSYTSLWNYKDNNKIEKDDVENSNKGKFLRLCCSVNRNGKKFNCEKLRKPRLRNKCKTIQEEPGYYCGGVNVFDGDNQTDEDSLMMM